MDAQLHDFIRNPSWELGVPLIEKYKKDIPEFRKKIIEAHRNSFALDMLYSHLLEISEKQEKPTAPESIAKDPEKVKEKAYRVEYRLPLPENLPTDLVELREQVITMLRSQQEARGVLKVAAYHKDPDERALNEIARGILRTESDLQDAYLRLDYYDRYKKYLPGTEPVTGIERIKELVRRQIINYTYINKYKKSSKPEILVEVERRQEELNELKKWLDE